MNCDEIASGMFMSPGYWVTWVGDRYASDAPIWTVPVAAAETPVPDPVDAVVTVDVRELLLGAAHPEVEQRVEEARPRLEQ